MVKNHPAIANKMPNCQVKAEGNVPRSGARTISIKWKKGFALSKRIPALFGNSSGIQMIGVRKKRNLQQVGNNLWQITIAGAKHTKEQCHPG